MLMTPTDSPLLLPWYSIFYILYSINNIFNNTCCRCSERSHQPNIEDRVQCQLGENCQLLLLLPVPTCMAYWSIKLLVSAALVIPDWVGWSGTSHRNSSKFFLNVSTVHLLKFLRWEGSKLNSLLPLMPRELSLALFTAAGAVLTYGLGTTIMHEFYKRLASIE